MTCEEYLNEDEFSYTTFFILAQGDLSTRKFCEVTGIGSTQLVSKTRSTEPSMPSLKTVKRLADYTNVSARKLWLKVCNEFFDKKDDIILHRC